jgi:hypothetical protein
MKILESKMCLHFLIYLLHFFKVLFVGFLDIMHTFGKTENGGGDVRRPRRALAEADSVGGPAEQDSPGPELAVLGRLKVQPHRVPDEGANRPVTNRF